MEVVGSTFVHWGCVDGSGVTPMAPSPWPGRQEGPDGPRLTVVLVASGRYSRMKSGTPVGPRHGANYALDTMVMFCFDFCLGF